MATDKIKGGPANTKAVCSGNKAGAGYKAQAFFSIIHGT
jgi:hypothetical protein